MGEIKKFVHHGASQVNMRILEGIHAKLPMLKIEIAQLNAPKFPHLVEQLEFLADVIEDFMEGADKDIPLGAVTEAAFALAYVHKQADLIPNSLPGIGFADDSSVTRCVLMENERVLREYAIRADLDWDAVTVNP